MKATTVTLMLSFFLMTAHSQNFKFEHTGARAKMVSGTKLKTAIRTSELQTDSRLKGCGTIEFISTEISALCEGKLRYSKHTNDTLSAEQKQVLSAVDPGSEFVIKINYKVVPNKIDAVNSPSEIRAVEFAFVRGPEIEAQFPGGEKKMAQFIDETILSKKLDQDRSEKLSRATVVFTVNEDGKAEDVRMGRTSSDAELDALLLETIGKMPRWEPAQNADGAKVKQRFCVNIPTKTGC